MNKFTLGIYQHYKGKHYEVIGTAHHSETLEEFVVYRALYRTKYGIRSLWVRPKKMFCEKINLNGKSVPRFKFIRHRIPK